MSHRLTCFTHFLALAGGSLCVVVWFGVWFVLLFVSPPFVCFVLQVQGIPISHFSRVLDDRQCFTARSARRQKNQKKSV